MQRKACLCASKGAAAHEPVLYRAGYDGLFDTARQLGFDGVEIHLRSAQDVDADALAEASRRTGVELAAIATGLAKRIDGLELVDADTIRRQEAIDRLKGMLDLAAHFGCRVIVGSMRGNIPSPRQEAATRAALHESMRAVADYISDKNCTVVFEAINRYENNYLNTAAETVDFLQHLGSAKVNLLLDTFHMNIEERDMPGAIRTAGPHLGHIHLADNTRRYPGSGALDFAAVLRTLDDIAYEGWLSFEYLPLPDEQTAAARGLGYIRRLEECLA